MSDYKNVPIRPVDMGINLVQAPDVLDAGKWVSLHNVEPIQEAILPTRPGRRVHLDTLTGQPIHSFIRLSTSSLLLGIGTSLYRDDSVIATGFSGNPLTLVSGQDGLIYVGDTNKIVIVDAGGTVYNWGIVAPTQASAFSAVGVGTLDSSVAGAVVYDWRYTYYSTKTNTESNASPVVPGIAVVLQQGAVQVFKSNDPQVDQIRLYRRGGTLGDAWRLVTILSNTNQVVNDNVPDSTLTLFAQLLDTNYPPFTSEDSAGNVLFGVPLPYIWGPFLGKVIFATGDPNRPNLVYWTNFDSFGSSDVNNFEAVSGTIEPLMNGWMFGSLPFVASRDAVYAIDFGNSADPTFSARRTPVGRGISGHWAFAVGPLVYMLSKDGIYETDCQSPNVQSITENTLRPIFQGHTIQGQGIPTSTNAPAIVSDEILGPVDFSKDAKLRLTYANHEVHFFYEDTSGLPHHLIYHTGYKRWRSAGMGQGVAVRLAYFDANASTSRLLLATNNGKVYVPDPAKMDDDGIPIEVKAKSGDLTNAFGFGTFQNLLTEVVPANPAGSPIDVAITPQKGQFENWGYQFTVPGETQTGATLGRAVKSRFTLTGSPEATGTSAQEARARFGLLFEWVGRAAVRQLMLQFRAENENVLLWDSGETTHGLTGWQHVKDLYLTMRGSSSDGDYTLTHFVDNTPYTYTFAAPVDNAKQKIYVPLAAKKGKLFRYRVTAPPDASLTIHNDLKAAWRFEEITGSRADSVGSSTLTEHNVLPNAQAGLIGNAVTFVRPISGAASSTHHWLELLTNSTVQLGNRDFTIAFWVNFASIPDLTEVGPRPGERALVCLDGINGNDYFVDYTLRTTAIPHFQWNYRYNRASPFSSGNNLNVNFTIETGVWYLVIVDYRRATQTGSLQINNGTIHMTASSRPADAPTETATTMFRVGNRGGLNSVFHDGQIDALHIWHRLLTTGERTYLYNRGVGREVYTGTFTGPDTGYLGGFNINAGECEVRAKPWSSRLGYQLINPFQPGDTPGQEP